MCANHKKILVADLCHTSFRRAAVDGAILPNHVGIANLNSAFCLHLKTQVLRRSTDDRTVPDKIAGAYSHRPFDDYVRLDDALLANNNFRPNYCVWPDLYIRAELRPLVDNCGLVNFHSTPASLKLK